MYEHRSTHDNPVRVRDGITGKETCFAIGVNAAASDNPMQSEMAGHIGSKGDYFCRKCEVGSNQAEKREDNGFHGMFLVRYIRTP